MVHGPPTPRAAPSPEEVFGADVAAALRAEYQAPIRHYHTLAHAHRVAAITAELGARDRPSQMAAWAHDVIYDPGADDNEAASAGWLRARLPGDADVDEAARLILLTADHRPCDGDRRGQALCDADLSILGADHDTYAAYARDVRREHQHVPEPDWRLGRARVLHDLLDRGRLFHTEPAWLSWESQARINLAAELGSLSIENGEDDDVEDLLR